MYDLGDLLFSYDSLLGHKRGKILDIHCTCMNQNRKSLINVELLNQDCDVRIILFKPAPNVFNCSVKNRV